MNYIVNYICEDHNFATPPMDEKSTETFCETLKNSGINFTVLEREEKKYKCPKCIFDIQILPEAKKAVKNNKEIDGLYTFGDPNEIAKPGDVCEVKLANGKTKTVYVVSVWEATANEIIAYKKEIGYEHLSLIIKKI